jgi:hypothetical protein
MRPKGAPVGFIDPQVLLRGPSRKSEVDHAAATQGLLKESGPGLSLINPIAKGHGISHGDNLRPLRPGSGIAKAEGIGLIRERHVSISESSLDVGWVEIANIRVRYGTNLPCPLVLTTRIYPSGF